MNGRSLTHTCEITCAMRSPRPAEASPDRHAAFHRYARPGRSRSQSAKRATTSRHGPEGDEILWSVADQRMATERAVEVVEERPIDPTTLAAPPALGSDRGVVPSRRVRGSFITPAERRLLSRPRPGKTPVVGHTIGLRGGATIHTNLGAVPSPGGLGLARFPKDGPSFFSSVAPGVTLCRAANPTLEVAYEADKREPSGLGGSTITDSSLRHERGLTSILPSGTVRCAKGNPASARQVELVGSDPFRRRPPARAARRTRVPEDRQVHTPEQNPSRTCALLPLASHPPDARGDRALARQGLVGRARAGALCRLGTETAQTAPGTSRVRRFGDADRAQPSPPRPRTSSLLRGALTYRSSKEKFPTGALATFVVDSGSWAALGPGDAELVDYVVPRQLG